MRNAMNKIDCKSPGLALASGLVLTLGLAACDASSTRSDGEVVVLLVIDTLRQDALGCYGRDDARTPRLDALAAEGVRFDQAISSSGWTLPSVASLLTGTWPTLHKATGKKTRLTPITTDLPVAAEVFKAGGYATLGFANAAFLSPMLGLDRGFDLFDHRHAYNQEIRRADETVDAALGELAKRPSEKVFVLLHLFDVHLDYDPPDGFIEPFAQGRSEPPPPLSMRQCMGMGHDGAPPVQADIDYVRALYQGELAFVDRAVGRLVDGLEELELWDGATLVVTSDHGEEFWDHGGFEHGHTLYDELIRVPLIIRLPAGGAIQSPVVDAQVRTIDIMPTLFELGGLEAPSSFVGSSLLPLVAGEAQPAMPAFSQSTLYGASKLSWRADPYQLVYDLAPDVAQPIELYDFRADPLTQHDLALEKPKVAKRLHRDLARFYNDLKQRAQTISTPEVEDMSPTHVKEYLESIESLGYAGRGEEEGEE
jgi:arylsulfatase A-like enzyme